MAAITSQHTPQMVSQALLYAGVGIHVFPVNDQKEPLTGKGGFHHATTDREQIERWWKKWPNAGIATPDFDVVDVDIYKPGGAQDWKQIQPVIPAGTPQQKTPRGGMQFFFAPGSLSSRKFANTIDLRYAGRNYVLLPPSRFADHGRYEWVTSVLKRKPRPAPQFPDSVPRNGPAPAIADKIPHGSQHYELVSLAGSMRRRGMNSNEIFAALWQVNIDRCEIPGPEANIRQIAESVAQYEPSRPIKPVANDDHPDTDSWQPLNLADPQYAIPPEPPHILGLLYRGKRHVISGPPESIKTLFAYIFTLTALRAGHKVAVIDFEMGPTAAHRLFTDIGATLDELAHIYYVAPETGPDKGLQGVIDHGTQLATIDAAIGAYDVSRLDDNQRKDVEAWARMWIRPLNQNEIATLVIDHVVKNADARGKFSIGSERKLGGADIHLGLEAIQTLTRGGKGLAKIHVHKDRPGFLPRPLAALVDLHSDPETHQITWHLKPPDATTEGFRPTRLMEKVSRYLELQDANRSTIHDHVQGQKQALVTAIDRLLQENYCSEVVPGKKGTIITSNRPYREDSDESFPNVPIVPDSGPHVPGNVPPPTGGNGNGNDPEPNPQLDVFDPEVQRLLDDPEGYDRDIPF